MLEVLVMQQLFQKAVFIFWADAVAPGLPRHAPERLAVPELLDRSADGAAALDRTMPDLFGTHPVAGAYRRDFCGALVISEDDVSSLTATRTTFVDTAFHRGWPGKPVSAVPI